MPFAQALTNRHLGVWEEMMLAKTDWPENFGEQFWEVYPRRVAKKAAMKALDKVRKAGECPFEVLLSAVKVYARAVAHRDMQYVAHPATWLNAGRWDDDPAAIGTQRRGIADAFDALIARAEERERAAGFGDEDGTVECIEGCKTPDW